MKYTSLFIIFFCTSLFPLYSGAQTDIPTCNDLKKGIFYMYPKNSDDHFVIIRENDTAHEFNTVAHDSTLWQINWTGDCSYTLKYLSGNMKIPAENLSFLKKHKLLYEVTKLTSDYYAFKGYVDNTSSISFQSDTIWFSEKATPQRNLLFQQVITDDPATPLVTDTSKYAILYVYRPGKITNSLGNYIIYFDNNIMCLGRNNSGYIFKILKEGNFNIKSKLFEDESSVSLNVKFGKTYYAKSMIHWDINWRYNFKLEMAIVDTETGKIEFAKVKLR